nr:branched-chain amino acid ABC transporter permease [Bradyrhizobium sp. BR2003]
MNGLLLGGLYAAMAAGFSLVWGVLNIINIMQGSAVVLGSYTAYFAWRYAGINPLLAIAVAGPVLFAAGWLLQRFLIQRVVTAPVLITLVFTFGLDLILNNAMISSFSADYRKIEGAFPTAPFTWGALTLPVDRLLAAVVGVGAALALHFYLHRSRLGRAIVAVRMDRHTAELMGVQVELIYAMTFGLGLAMAGVAGCLLAAIFPTSPLNSAYYLHIAFVACVLGGLGSVLGAVVGGFLLGVVESLGSLFVGAEYGTSVAAVILLLMLLTRPQGLLGRAGYE